MKPWKLQANEVSFPAKLYFIISITDLGLQQKTSRDVLHVCKSHTVKPVYNDHLVGYFSAT